MEPYKKKEKLEQLYLKENKSQSEIAKIFNINRSTVKYYLIKFNLKKEKMSLDRETLFDLYIKQNKTVKDIAKIFKVNRTFINNYLMKFNISKEKYLFEKITYEKIYQLYVIESKTVKEISEIFNIPFWKMKNLINKRFKITKNSIFDKNNIVECKNIKRKKSPNWKGCGDLSGSSWRHIVLSAKKRNLEINISIEYAWDLFLKQNKKCALTNYKLSLDKYRDPDCQNIISGIGSLDRIDNSQGYIEGNVQWVLSEINFMKYKYSQEVFIELCNMVSEKNNVYQV